MTLARYDFVVSENFLVYTFYSNGPKGYIKKIVEFEPINSYGKTFFNLSFGDWNEKLKRIDDRIITNNMDTKKFLLQWLL